MLNCANHTPISYSATVYISEFLKKKSNIAALVLASSFWSLLDCIVTIYFTEHCTLFSRASKAVLLLERHA